MLKSTSMPQRCSTASRLQVHQAARSLSAALGPALLIHSLPAQEVLLREGGEPPANGTFTVPFAFYSDSLGASAGASIGNRGFFQPQASAFATAVVSANGSVYIDQPF